METLKREARWNVSTVSCTGGCKFKLRCHANCGCLVPLFFHLPFSHVQYVQRVFTPASKNQAVNVLCNWEEREQWIFSLKIKISCVFERLHLHLYKCMVWRKTFFLKDFEIFNWDLYLQTSFLVCYLMVCFHRHNIFSSNKVFIWAQYVLKLSEWSRLSSTDWSEILNFLRNFSSCFFQIGLL